MDSLDELIEWKKFIIILIGKVQEGFGLLICKLKSYV